jgi:shikimate kinase
LPKTTTVRYFIIGFKNSGKTTFGRKLAEMTGLAFVDLDEYIEQLEGHSVADIYTRLGDEGFRRIEWKALRKAVRTDDLVIATGGGAPCHCENMNLMEQHGKVIYLNVSDETLVDRLKVAALDRPIVKGKTEEELRQYVSALRDRCEHNYLRASYIIDGDNLNAIEVAAMLKDQID